MKILFLPNFSVERLREDDPMIKSPNKIVDGADYWFFKGLRDVFVDVIDNWSPQPLAAVERRSGVELTQALRAIAIQREYDAVLSHSYNSGFAFSMIRSLGRESQPPHIVIDIGCLNGNRSDPIQIALIRKSLKSVNGLIYHSRVNEEFYSSHFPDLRRRFIPFGMDTQFFKPMSETPTDDYVLSIGKTFRDYRTLVSAWRHIDYPLRIVGPKRLDTGDSRRIELIPEISITDLNKLIHNARFVILPIEGRRYSMGQMTTLQCMAMRKPIIVTDVPGVRDYVCSGKNCLTIREGSEDDIERAVQQLLRDKELAERIAAEARSNAVARFDERTMASEIISFISEVSQDAR